MPHETMTTLRPADMDALPIQAARRGNRRGEGRKTLHLGLSVTLLVQPARPPIKIDTRDLTLGGIGFVACRAFASGECFALLLRFANNPGRLILCQSVFSRPDKDGLHHTGAKFVEIITAPASGKFPARWLEIAARAGAETTAG